jgi:cytochrome c biogenesis protein CcmG/thiol:disulfide interchange protein DsbE
VQEFGGKARFMVENYGDSELAKRFGVTRYPAVFVDDVLVAKPKDFGFYGKGEGKGDGRYTPFKSAASHERFRADLSRMIQLILAGRKDDARARATPPDTGEIPTLPPFTLADLDGGRVSHDDLAGRVVLVEFWATWCPPCRGALGWLGELKKQYGDRIAVLAVAVDSEEADVRKLAGELKLPLVWTMGTSELARAFGDVSVVPTLMLFGRDGRTSAAFYGAAPGLHAEAEAKLAALVKQGRLESSGERGTALDPRGSPRRLQGLASVCSGKGGPPMASGVSIR